MIQKVILIMIFIMPKSINSQIVTKSLQNPNSFYFKKHVYVFGYQQKVNHLYFKCFRFSNSLQLKDSTSADLGNYKTDQFLEITTDTLHNVINFYFQLANQKNLATLLRLNDTLETICFIKNFDANHINSFIAFDEDKIVYNQDLYLNNVVTDTLGKQFYITKYKVKSILEPFEYEQNWQFAIDRKFIKSASVIFANSNFVLIHTHVYDGTKKGEWILKLNAQSGKLIRGTKLNKNNDDQLYLMSNFFYDSKQKTIDVIGSIYQNKLLDVKNRVNNEQLFLIKIDSLGNIISRTEKTLSMPLQSNKLNIGLTYHLKIREFTKTIDNNYNVWADIYESNTPLIFSYVSSWQINLTATDIDYDVSTSKFMNGAIAIPNLVSSEIGNTYGKFYIKTPDDYDTFKHKKLKNTVIIKTGIDENNNSFFIYKKMDIKNSTVNFYHVFTGKKGVENKIILKTNKSQQAAIYCIETKKYLSFNSNVDNTIFEIKTNIL